MTSLSQGPHRRPAAAGGAHKPGINHRFSIQSAQSQPRQPKAIRIVSDIILHPPTNQPPHPQQRHQAPGQPLRGKGPGRRGQRGQGLGDGKRQQRPYNLFNRSGGSRNGLPVNNANVHGHGHGFPHVPSGTNLPGAGIPGSHGRGAGRHGGIGPLAQLTLPVINRTDLLALFQNSPLANNTSGGGGQPGPGGASQFVLIPQNSNNGGFILSADPAAGFAFGSGAVIMTRGSNVIPSTQKPPGATGFVSIPTLKHGEDPPEVEHPSA